MRIGHLKYFVTGSVLVIALAVGSVLFGLSSEGQAATPLTAPTSVVTQLVTDDAGLLAGKRASINEAVRSLHRLAVVAHVATGEMPFNAPDARTVALDVFGDNADGWQRDSGELAYDNDGILLVWIGTAAPNEGSPFTVISTGNEPLRSTVERSKRQWDSPQARKLHADGDYASLALHILSTLEKGISHPETLNEPKPVARAKTRARAKQPAAKAETVTASAATVTAESVDAALDILHESHPMTEPVRREVRRITLAIRARESGGDYGANGGSGEYGAYQFMPSTWKLTAKAYFGSEAPALFTATPVEQDYVAARRIREFVAAGNDVREVALIWNGGSANEKSGVNKWGVAYDSGAYANSVVRQYQRMQ